MTKSSVYAGINIQYPVSQWILSGKKTIETRTYPIPKKYVNQRLLIIETPGSQAEFKARIIGFVTFGSCFQYLSEDAFYRDARRHLVDRDSHWRWDPKKPKYGWPIVEVAALAKPVVLTRQKGIRYTTGIKPP